jgi:replicative DNA helicase
MAVSLGSGLPFLNTFPVPEPVRVAFLSGEGANGTLQETARRICRAKQVELAKVDVHWCFDLPRFDQDADLAQLHQRLRDCSAQVVFFDSLYLCLLSGNSTASASNLYEVGPLLTRMRLACLDAGATPILLHHATKSSAQRGKGQPLDLDDLAFAGVAEFARQWLLLSRREEYQTGSGAHHLWMSVGGSAGQSGSWELEIAEGLPGKDFRGRRWGVKVRQAGKEKDPPGKKPRQRRPGTSGLCDWSA